MRTRAVEQKSGPGWVVSRCQGHQSPAAPCFGVTWLEYSGDFVLGQWSSTELRGALLTQGRELHP